MQDDTHLGQAAEPILDLGVHKPSNSTAQGRMYAYQHSQMTPEHTRPYNTHCLQRMLPHTLPAQGMLQACNSSAMRCRHCTVKVPTCLACRRHGACNVQLGVSCYMHLLSQLQQAQACTYTCQACQRVCLGRQAKHTHCTAVHAHAEHTSSLHAKGLSTPCHTHTTYHTACQHVQYIPLNKEPSLKMMTRSTLSYTSPTILSLVAAEPCSRSALAARAGPNTLKMPGPPQECAHCINGSARRTSRLPKTLPCPVLPVLEP